MELMEPMDCPWNRFVDRATEQAPQVESETLFYALFWYQAEVSNGGHYQYFLNRSEPAEWKRAVKAARSIGQNGVAENLESAISRWQSVAREEPETAEAFVEEALEEEFGDADSRFYAFESGFSVAFERAVDEGRRRDASLY